MTPLEALSSASLFCMGSLMLRTTVVTIFGLSFVQQLKHWSQWENTGLSTIIHHLWLRVQRNKVSDSRKEENQVYVDIPEELDFFVNGRLEEHFFFKSVLIVLKYVFEKIKTLGSKISFLLVHFFLYNKSCPFE